MPWFDSLITIIIIWIWYMKQAIAGRNSNYKRRRNAKLSAQNSQAVSQAVAAGEGRQAAGSLAQPYIIIFSISKACVPSWTTQWDPIYTVNTLTVKNSGVIQAHFPCFLAAKTWKKYRTCTFCNSKWCQMGSWSTAGKRTQIKLLRRL